MSSKGIYTAVSGAIAQSSKLDTLANNIANSNTASFKKDRQVFNEYLSAYEKTNDVIQVPKIPASVDSFYDLQGADRGYVNSAGSYTDFSQGSIKQTGNKLDLALEGEGFFEVLTNDGVKLTRNGSFSINENGQLVTKEGFLVLKEGNQDPNTRSFQIGSNRDVTVSYDGSVYIEGNNLGKLSTVSVVDKNSLQKTGGSFYSIKNNFPQQTIPTGNLKIHQGYIEGSNVNIVAEMTDMIGTTRAFESTQQAIKAFDQMDSKLVNEVGRIR